MPGITLPGYRRRPARPTGCLRKRDGKYACRAGTTSRYSFGDAITARDVNYADSGLGRVSEVGAYPANRWGLHDMHGHVWEWVEDDWHELPGSADGRIAVEGCGNIPGYAPLRVARRLLAHPFEVLPVCLPHEEPIGIRYSGVGFRVARTLS